MAIELLTSITYFLPVNDRYNLPADGCTSIAFQNNSSDEFDADGRNVGYQMVINDIWVIKPGGQFSVNQNLGFKDGSVYRISFKAVDGTPPTAIKAGVIAVVSTKSNC